MVIRSSGLWIFQKSTGRLSLRPMSLPSENASRLPAAPLAGVKVIDFGQYTAGPGAAMTLAELGATVIKIEPLSGDQARHVGRYGESMVRAYNRGKRSVALDL